MRSAAEQLRQEYDVSADGQQFLINVFEQPPTGPITLILNWKPKR